jgi:hypothetical protein
MKTFSSRLPVCSIRGLLLVLALGVSACGTTLQPIEPVETQYIEFRCDSVINAGKPLAIDILYITYVQELREVARIGPTDWFKTQKREEWKFKEQVMLKGGDEAVVKLDPLILDRTVLLVIYANYQNVLAPSNKQVVIDFAGKTSEIISVEKSRLQPRNKSIRYVK